jgi:hypothetical protein
MGNDEFAGACARTRLLICPEDFTLTPQRHTDDPGHIEHLVWMLGQARDFHAAGKVEKANRWLGFVQGLAFADREVTLEQLKRANMPEGATFDGERV